MSVESLYVKSTPPRIFEVTGSQPNFGRNIVVSKPESTNRHVESIKVGDINEGDMKEFYSIVEQAEIDDDNLRA